MTTEEMYIFFGQRAERTKMVAAMFAEQRNFALFSQNVHQGFKCCLLRGLVGWRTGLGSPYVPIRDAVERVIEGLRLLRSSDQLDFERRLPVETTSIAGFLVDAPQLDFSSCNLTADRLLDAVLSDGLRGIWNDLAWKTGLEQLGSTKRTALAVETYLTYERLLHSTTAESEGLIELAAKLFDKRSKDGFFSGGEQTEGGGSDNAVTVDYRLAAVMKKVGYAGESVHRWRW